MIQLSMPGSHNKFELKTINGSMPRCLPSLRLPAELVAINYEANYHTLHDYNECSWFLSFWMLIVIIHIILLVDIWFSNMLLCSYGCNSPKCRIWLFCLYFLLAMGQPLRGSPKFKRPPWQWGCLVYLKLDNFCITNILCCIIKIDHVLIFINKITDAAQV